MGEIYIKKKKRGFNCLFLLLIASYSSFMEQKRGSAAPFYRTFVRGRSSLNLGGRHSSFLGAQNRGEKAWKNTPAGPEKICGQKICQKFWKNS